MKHFLRVTSIFLFLTMSIQAFATEVLQATDKAWDQIILQAKQEKQVSWFIWFNQAQFRLFVKPFEEKYGITVTIPDGNAEANLNKALAERNRKVGDIDVLGLGFDRLTPFFANHMLRNLTQLPDYNQLTSSFHDVSGEGQAVVFWGSQTGLAYDPMKIDEKDLPQTFEDLVQFIQNNPKQFAYNDLNGGGAGGSFIREVIRHYDKETASKFTKQFDPSLTNWSNTWKWLKENQNNITLTASNADSLTRLNDGEFALTAAWEDQLDSLQKQGAIAKRFKFYIPKFGMANNANFVTSLKNAKHPAAALLFIHWLTSPEVQVQFNEKFGSAPQNKMAKSEHFLVPMAQRVYSSAPFPSAYEIELKKQFIQTILLHK